MIVIKRDNPQIFGGKAFLMSEEESISMNAIAEAISIDKQKLIQLLIKNGYLASDTLTKEQLLNQLSEAFKNKNFATDFAKQYAKKYSPKYSNYSSYEESSSMIKDDTENTSFWEGTYNSNSDSTTKNKIGAGGYLSLINGIIGGVGSILGIFSKPDNTGQQLTYNQQILMLAAEKEAQKKRNQTIAIIVVIIVVLGIAGFTFYYAKKQKAI